jgi:hypothetical protein
MKRPNHSIALVALSAELALAATSSCAQAQATSHAGDQRRAIKALSDGDVASLLAGQGAGLPKAAELDGCPGPAHTLEPKDRLGLDAAQVSASAALMAAHKAGARDIGAALVQAERVLDGLFASRGAHTAAVEDATRAVGLLGAQLRAEHLNTHLARTALLSAGPNWRNGVLRGHVDRGPADASGISSPKRAQAPLS